ncbi:MAG: 4Fe-4S binding protein [Coriobacteriia bacterium]|nr:4Fe-4S binding protein [Coriobacteriia bacterium]
MIRKIIQIDEAKCNGCGACVTACHEGAIGMVNGKAKLLRDDYCDGLGDCLPQCPTGAIAFVEREAAPYDAAAVAANMAKRPGLQNWPVQIKLAPTWVPYFDGADLLVAADCTAFTYAGFFQEFVDGSTVLIGCPKLDAVDYAPKLAQILEQNDVRSVTLARMEVPCCGGLERALRLALQASGKDLPLVVKTVSTDGRLLD